MDNKPQFITRFIELYRQFPCLWKVRDVSYANKQLKEDAYRKLLEFYKTAVPAATVETVKKKINNLRCAFRKELKKVKSAHLPSPNNEVYTPSLWYYDLLLFTFDQDDCRNQSDIIECNSDSNRLSLEEYSILPDSQPENEVKAEPSISSGEFTAPSFANSRKRSIDTALAALRDDDEFDAVGLNVTCKLRRMDDEQRLHAELLINKVLINGLKGRLREETNISGLLFVRK